MLKNNKICCCCLLIVQLLFFINTVKAKTDPQLKFIENKNQWADSVLYRSNISGGTVSLHSDRFRFCFINSTNTNFEKGHHNYDVTGTKHYEDGTQRNVPSKVHIYDVQFIGSNRNVTVTGKRQFQTIYNYYFGNDKSRWVSGAKSYSTINYINIYNGIDLSVYSDKGRMKYEWIVSPETDPSQIKLTYNGINDISIDNGNLYLKTSINEIWEYKPYAYQLKDNHKIVVPCEYHLEDNEITYVFTEGYDPCYELTIDPILIFSAYSGSTMDNWGNTATYDSRGNVYSGGMVNNPTKAPGFPTTPGAYQIRSAGGDWDVGILKYDSSGSQLLYATYIGGDSVESPQSMVVNSKDELLILGATNSPNFPITNGSKFKGGTSIDPLHGVFFNGGTDLFIAKLSKQGDSLLGTLAGGNQNDGVNFISGFMGTPVREESPIARNYGDQLRGDIITDLNDTIYIASNTMSANFPGRLNAFSDGSHDALVIKILPDLSEIIWSKYLGGSGTDAAYSIKLNNGKIYVAGGTNSPNFQGVNGLQKTYSGEVDGWIASLSTKTAQTINATYIGTERYDQTYFIDLNEVGEVYTFGQTKGAYPVTQTSAIYSNPYAGQFIHKLTSDLKTTIFSTTIGSNGSDVDINPNISPTAFLVSDCNNIYLSGWGGAVNTATVFISENETITRNYIGGNTFNMPISTDAYQRVTEGSDFYLMVLSDDASEFLYGTYLGGNTSPTHVDGGTSRFDKRGIVYHAVCAGCGGRSDFPAVNVPAEHQFNNSDNCNNAVFKFDLAVLRARIQTNTVKLDMPGFNKVCIPDKIVFQNKSVGGKRFDWDLGDGTTITKTDTTAIVHEYKSIGKYTVKLKAIDERTCIGEDMASTIVDVYNTKTKVQDDDALCFGTPYPLTTTGSAFFDWTSDNSSFQSQDTKNIHYINPDDTTVYFVTIYEEEGCIKKDTVQLNVIPKIDVDFKLTRISDCFNRSKVQVSSLTTLESTDNAFFDFGDGQTSDADNAEHTYLKDSIYHVKLVALREFCAFEKSMDVAAYLLKVPNVITPGSADGNNDVFTIQYGETKGVTPGDFGIKTSLEVYDSWGKPVYESKDYQYNWSAEGLPAGVYYFKVTVEDHATCKSWLQVIK